MMLFFIEFMFIIAVLDSTKRETSIRLMTYNVMRGRYDCFEEKLKANEDFRRSLNTKYFRYRTDFVRTNLATIANHIRQLNSDIIAIQEVQESLSSISKSINKFNIS